MVLSEKKYFFHCVREETVRSEGLFEVIGYDVRQLDRVSFAGLTPLGLPRGNWRFLDRSEINYLKKLAGSTSRKEIDEIYS